MPLDAGAELVCPPGDPPGLPRDGSQWIIFGPLADKTFGDADFTVHASATSGLRMSFGASGKCTIGGAVVHITGVGYCTITASQSGDAHHKPAYDVLQTFAIAKGATAQALAASGTWDAFVNLPYRVDGKGNVATGITVRKSGIAVAHLRRGYSNVRSGRVYALGWKAPEAKTTDTYRFCVTLHYRAHTTSTASCARIQLR